MQKYKYIFAIEDIQKTKQYIVSEIIMSSW